MFSTQKFFNLSLSSLGFIIAVTSIIYSVMGVCSSAITYNQTKKTEQVNTEGGDVLSEDDFLDTLSTILSYGPSVSHIISLIVCPLLLVALIKKKPIFILPWLIYWATTLIFNWVICVVVSLYMTFVDTVISAKQMSHTVHTSMAMGLFFALWVAMLSLRKEQKKENTS